MGASLDKQLSDGEMPRHHGKTGDVVDWSDGLLTGMDDIDDDHRKLIDIINELGRLRGSNSSPDSLIKTFGELKDYTVYHFQREQALMNDWSVNKTHKSMHLKAHAGFIARIEKAGELIDAHPNYVVDHVLGFLVGWLLHHISDVDTSLVKEIENLRDGTKPDYDDVQGSMSETIEEGLSHLTETDLAAIARYIRTVPPIVNRVRRKAK